jgi:hypothetical protein
MYKLDLKQNEKVLLDWVTLTQKEEHIYIDYLFHPEMANVRCYAVPKTGTGKARPIVYFSEWPLVKYKTWLFGQVTKEFIQFCEKSPVLSSDGIILYCMMALIHL